MVRTKCSLQSDTGLPVLLPFRMSSFVLSNLVVTAGMLTPGMGVSVSYVVYRTSANEFVDDRNTSMADHQSIS